MKIEIIKKIKLISTKYKNNKATKMIEFTTYTKKVKQDLLKPVTLFLKVTNSSNKTIEVAKELLDIEFFENGKKTDGFTHFYTQNQLTYVTLEPNEFFETKCEKKHYLSFQKNYKKQVEKIAISLNVNFFIKGLPNKLFEFITQKNTLELEVDFTSLEILVTPDNKPSKYIKYNGNVVYISAYSRAYEKPSKKINIDQNSLKIIDSVYIIDKEKVFRDGNLQRISSNGFKVFNQLFSGNDEKVLTTYGDANLNLLKVLMFTKVLANIKEAMEETNCTCIFLMRVQVQDTQGYVNRAKILQLLKSYMQKMITKKYTAFVKEQFI